MAVILKREDQTGPSQGIIAFHLPTTVDKEPKKVHRSSLYLSITYII